MTAQALKTLLSGLGVSVDGPVTDFDLGDQLASLAAQNAKKEVKVENVAAVMVTAEIPPLLSRDRELISRSQRLVWQSHYVVDS
jgi:flagellar basal body P-ring protein FlgI